jgi:hypothetical protein
MLARRTIFDVELLASAAACRFDEQVYAGRASLVRGVVDELTARRLDRYFKSGSGRAFAKKRFLKAAE